MEWKVKKPQSLQVEDRNAEEKQRRTQHTVPRQARILDGILDGNDRGITIHGLV